MPVNEKDNAVTPEKQMANKEKENIETSKNRYLLMRTTKMVQSKKIQTLNQQLKNRQAGDFNI